MDIKLILLLIPAENEIIKQVYLELQRHKTLLKSLVES